MALTLEQARMLKKISREKAAKEIGVNPVTILRWETGKSYPDIIQFKKLCALYECDIDSIFFATDTN